MEGFAAWGEEPPGVGFAGAGLVDGGHEGVKDAGILALTRLLFEAAVKRVRLLGGELLERPDAEEIEVAEHGGADVSQLG